MTCLTNGLTKKMCKFSGIIWSLALFFTLNSAFAADKWQTLAPGIAYRQLPGYLAPWSHIHVFRISLKENTFSNVMATSLSKKLTSAQEIAKRTQALLAINGGFFDNQYRPLGLRVSQYSKTNPLKSISWWGVFYIKNKKPYISSFKEFTFQDNIEFAMQSGPRLLVNRETVSLKPGIAERTALGITKNKQVIILITESSPITTAQLASIMQSAPLFCTDALNLDGGSSTQMHAAINGFQKQIYGYSQVSDVVIVKPRAAKRQIGR